MKGSMEQFEIKREATEESGKQEAEIKIIQDEGSINMQLGNIDDQLREMVDKKQISEEYLEKFKTIWHNIDITDADDEEKRIGDKKYALNKWRNFIKTQKEKLEKQEQEK